jgi:predicted acetyltransferase
MQYDKDEISQNYSKLKYIYDSFIKNYDEYRVRDDYYFNWLIKRCLSFHEKIYIYTYLDQLDGYMIYHTNNQNVYVSEFIYLNEQAKNRMIATLCDQFDEVVIECDLNIDIKGSKEKIITMLSNYNYDIAENHKYINEIY